MKLNTLNKHERLKSRKVIECLLSEAQTFHFFPIRVLYKIISVAESEPLKVCVSVSKRKFKHAVDRNRLKRQIRECWRVNKLELKQTLAQNNLQMIVMLIYTSKEKEDFPKINKKVSNAVKRLVAESERIKQNSCS